MSIRFSLSQKPFAVVMMELDGSRHLVGMLAEKITEKVHGDARTHLVIVTFDEENSITDKHGTIEVVPCWKWLLEFIR